MHLHGRASVGLRSLQPAWPNKMDAEAMIPWSSLAKLSRTHHAMQYNMRIAFSNRANNQQGRFCSIQFEVTPDCYRRMQLVVAVILQASRELNPTTLG